MTDPKNTQNAKSASPGQDIVKPEKNTAPTDSTPQPLQDIVKPK